MLDSAQSMLAAPLLEGRKAPQPPSRNPNGSTAPRPPYRSPPQLVLQGLTLSPQAARFVLAAAEDALTAQTETYEKQLSRGSSRHTSPYSSPKQQPPSKQAAGPSWHQVGITIANCLVGAGALSMPYALRMAGWAGLVVILTATLITCYTAKCLVRSFNTLNAHRGSDRPEVETYDELVEECFGRAGAIGMKLVTVVELYGGTICMVVLHAVKCAPRDSNRSLPSCARYCPRPHRAR